LYSKVTLTVSFVVGAGVLSKYTPTGMAVTTTARTTISEILERVPDSIIHVAISS
jgi:hypothetical protein